MFIAAPFTIARTWKQPRCPSTDEWIKKLWYIYTMEYSVQFSSVAQSYPTLCDPMNCTQHARPPCPSPTPRVYSNPCPSSRWCHPTISTSVIPFSSCPQSLPASGSFPMHQLSAWGGPSTGVSASASVLPMNTQDWSPLGWTGWISLQSKGLLFSHKKEYIWISSNEADEPRAYYTEWSKSEREKQISYTNTYIWNLEWWYWWNYLQGDTDIENSSLMDPGVGRRKERVGRMEKVTWKLTLPCVK